jgi:hypothetical protein
MALRKYIIIDYINLATVFHLVQKHKSSNVIALFRPASKVIEGLLIKLLNIFDIRYQLDKMEFSKLPVNLYQEILVDTNNMVDKLMLLYENKPSSKTMRYFNYKLRNELFNLLWRPNSIFKYARKYNKVDGIYISIKTKRIFKNQYYKLLVDEKYKKITFCYNGIGGIDDTGYLFRRPPVSRKFRLLAYIFYIPLEFKNMHNDIYSLFFSHDKNTIQGWINGIKVGKYVDFTHKIVWPDRTIGQASDNLVFRRIYWKDLASYFLHVKNGLIRFSPLVSSIGFDIYSVLIKDWINLFLLRSFYKKNGVRIVYSNFDSDFTQLALAIATDNKKIVSFSAIWSLGNFPLEGMVTFQKFADRFFIWGKWHYSLLSSSNDKSSGYVITGYIGDIYLSKMRKDAILLRSKYKKNYNHIIALYDTSMFPDLFFNDDIANNLLRLVMRIAEQFNSLVILKTKFKSNLYHKIDGYYLNNLIIDCEKGSLVPALAADVVVGIGNSTPASLAAVYNKRVINFNPANSVWKYWKSTVAKDIVMVESLDAVRHELIKKLNMLDEPYININIDPFVDGKCQKRMAQYMCDVSNQLHKGKHNALTYADSNYIHRYGLDKIITNE